jgi:outer membrane protein assembly factor BamD
MTLQALGRHPLRLPPALATLSIGLAGCAGGNKTKKDVAYVARDVDTLYMAAKLRLDQGDAKAVAALFDEVERQHPYSPGLVARS